MSPEEVVIRENRILSDEDFSELVRTYMPPEEADRVINFYMTVCKQRDKAIELSERDPLTNLRNRRGFDYDLTKALSAAQRNGQNLSVLYIDLDGLKAVNDSGKHEDGDQYIHDAVFVLEKAIYRSNDQIYRVGGDEFTVILSDCDTAGAEKVVGRIHRKIKQAKRGVTTRRFQRDYLDKAGIENIDNFGMSIGIASTDIIGYNKDKLISFADEAMYIAKMNKDSVNRFGICRYGEDPKFALVVDGMERSLWVDKKTPYLRTSEVED